MGVVAEFRSLGTFLVDLAEDGYLDRFLLFLVYVSFLRACFIRASRVFKFTIISSFAFLYLISMVESREAGIAMSGYHLYYFGTPYSNICNKYLLFKVYSICFLREFYNFAEDEGP